MSDAEKAAPSAKEKDVEAETAARKTNFERHKEELLDPLRELYERERTTKPFDTHSAWQDLRILAHLYFRSEAEVSQEQAMMPAGDRVKLLRQARKSATGRRLERTANGQAPLRNVLPR